VEESAGTRLRARLDKYYASEGGSDPLIIELPKGGYRPLFRERTPGRPGQSARSDPARWVRAALAALLLAAGVGRSGGGGP
jgi:hypothetical protein